MAAVILALPKRHLGYLAVASLPEGALVSVDERVTGERTPATIRLSADVQHHVALELPGHAPWAQDVAVSPGEVRQLEAALEPLPGTVDLVSNPPGAEVWMDGRRTGLNTPVVLGPVAAGPHVVTLRMEGYGVEVGVPP